MALSIENNFGDNYSFAVGNAKNKYSALIPSFNKVNGNSTVNNIQNYASQGELIYEKKMDLDEDGTITFDEVRKYCDENKVNLDNVLNKWRAYQMIKNKQGISREVIKNIEDKNNKTNDNELVYAKVGDKNYDAQMDLNRDKIITYQEYNDYCAKHKNESKNNIKDIIKEYGLDEDESDNSLKSEGNIELDA